MRNPWGLFKWAGEYSDESMAWTEELKIQCNFCLKDDGSFYMTLDELKQHFILVFICHIRDFANYIHSSFQAVHLPNEFSLIRFTAEGPTGHAYLSVVQTSQCINECQYSNVRMCLAKIDGSGLKYMVGKMERKR